MARLLTVEEAVRQAAGEASAPGSGAVSASPRVLDLHCDTLDRLALHGDFDAPGGFAQNDAAVPHERMSSLARNDAHISLERTAAYRWAQCFAVYVPDVLQGGEAWAFYERVRGFWRSSLAEHAGALAQARCMDEAEAALAAGKTAGIATIEGASFLEDDGSAEGRLDELADDGVRMVTLTWNARNALGSGNDTPDGLTPFGRLCVAELERRRIAVDVSRLNEAGFKDVCACATRPFAASHSNARAITDHARNLADWQLREIAQAGGIVGLNFSCHFLHGPTGDATRDDVLRHVDHILETAGEGALALGSDYDGCDVPTWLDPCDEVRHLRVLIASEFGEQVAEQVFWGNADRFFRRIEE